MYARYHKSYEKRVHKLLLKLFRKWGLAIELEGSDFGQYGAQIQRAMPISDLYEVYNTIYLEVGLRHAERIGEDLNKQLKRFDIDQFAPAYEREVIDFLNKYGVSRIVTVRSAFFQEIMQILSKRLEDGPGEGLSSSDLADEIHKAVRQSGFYRWQALRIARTETTAASNYAAMKAGQNSMFEVEKIWISAKDGRTRRHPKDEYDHLEMDGKTVGKLDKFSFNNGMDELLYPGDPTGEPGNVINCRCSVAIRPKRDKNGELIPLF